MFTNDGTGLINRLNETLWLDETFSNMRVCCVYLQIAALTDRNHAYMVMDQLKKRGGRVLLAPLSAPPVEPEGKHSSTLVRSINGARSGGL